MSDQYEWVREEYGRFFDEVYPTYGDFKERYLDVFPDMNVTWQEHKNGVTLVEVVGDMMSEIIVIEEMI